MSDQVHRATRQPLKRGLLGAFFAAYLVLLTWIIVWKVEIPFADNGPGAVGERRVKLIPFIGTADYAASAPLEIAVNFLLFIPFGLFLGLLAPAWPPWKKVATIAGASLVLELIQFALALGSTDITDVIVNTAGGLVGIGLLALAIRAFGSGAATVMTWICVIGTVLLTLACLAFFFSPIHYR